MLVLDGAGVVNTQIAASATGPQSGPGGSVAVNANALTVEGGAQIASSTAGPGKGGDVMVTVANGVTLSGVGPSGASGITASAQPGSSGRAGEIVLMAGGAIALSGGAEVTSSTAGAGNGGTVAVTAQAPLTLTDPGTGIIALASSTASGNAGSVVVTAPQITADDGGRNRQHHRRNRRRRLGQCDDAGDIGAQRQRRSRHPDRDLGDRTAIGAGRLGDARSKFPDRRGRGADRQFHRRAGQRGRCQCHGGFGHCAAGPRTANHRPVDRQRRRRVDHRLGGSPADEQWRGDIDPGGTSTASGGNITLNVGDFLYLVSSEISTSVKGETGNGGNIAIDPQLMILNHSSIIAQAIEGHGGNITITADQFIPSSDSIVSASSELGISGTIVINGPRVTSTAR